MLLGGWRSRRVVLFWGTFNILGQDGDAVSELPGLMCFNDSSQLNSTQTPDHEGLRNLGPLIFFIFLDAIMNSQVTVFVRVAREANCWLGGVSGGLDWKTKVHR